MSEYDDLLNQVRSKPDAGAAPDNEYSALLGQVRNDRSVLEANLNLSSFADPEKAAQKNVLAGKLKSILGEDWAPSVVDPADAQRRLRIAENDHVLRNSPALSRKFIESGYAERTFDDVKQLAEVEKAARTFLGTLGDVGVTATKSAVGLPRAFAGLADIRTLGLAGKWLEYLGLDFSRAQKELDAMYSPAQQQANAAVRGADGFFDTLSQALQNPSVIATTAGESLAQMVGGAGIARGLMKIAPALGPLRAGALGEGTLAAGSAASQIRENTDDNELTAVQALSAVLSGIGTAVFGVMGGKLAQRFGIDDLDTVLAKGGIDKATAETVQKGFTRRLIEGGISEGVFEELPQSTQEQLWQNFALDRPLTEGVGNAAAMGMLAGVVTGAPFSAFSGYVADKRDGMQFERDALKAQSSLESELNLNNLVDVIAGTQTLARTPQDVADLLAEADEAGQTEVFINARQFANVFNQSAIETADRLGVDAQTLNDALTSNGDITVPLASLATNVAQDDTLRPLLEHARVDPGDMSPADARLWQSSQGEQFKAEAEAVLAQRQADEVYQTEVQGVYDNLLGQLNTARRFTPQVNERYASMVKDFYVTMADRAGMSVGEMAQRYPLRVQAEVGADETAFQQARIENPQAWEPAIGLTGAAEKKQIVALDDQGKDIGRILIYRDSQGNVTVSDIQVRPEHGRQGIATRLLDEAFNETDADHIFSSTGFTGKGWEFLNKYGSVQVDGKYGYARRKVETAVSPAPTSGPFGPIFTEFHHDAQGAIAKLTELQTGEAVGALHHPEIGDIDLVWGGTSDNPRSKGFGLAKLVRWHAEIIPMLSELLPKMKIPQGGRHKDSIDLHYGDYRASVTQVWDGSKKVLLLTAFDKKAKAGKGATTDTAQLDGKDDTASLSTDLDSSIEQDVKKFYQTTKQKVFGFNQTLTEAFKRWSNDAPLQQAAIESPEFRNWFGDSKVVDTDGRPLRVYHGTTGDFDSFDKGKQGSVTRATSSKSGFFFVHKPRTAQSYADHGALVTPVARLIDEADKAGDRGKWDLYDEKINAAEQLEAELSDPANRGRGQNLVPVYLNLRNPLVLDAKGETPAGIGGIDPLIQKAKRGGHDGVIIKNFDDAAGLANDNADHYIVFEPTQIKSATGNNGNYDPNDASILHQSARVVRQASTFSQAREKAKDFQGKPLTNQATKMEATVSRNNLDKMLNSKAVGKSETPAVHSLAVANLDVLFERAILGWSKPDSEGDPNIVAIHRFFTALQTENGLRMVKMTVKETAQTDRSNPLYTVEAVELNEKSPAAKWVGEIADADGIDPRTTGSVGDVLTLAQAIQDGKFAQDALGSFDPSTNTIALLDGANLSTFHHESAHFFLEVMADMAARPDAPPAIRQDFMTALKWFGVTGTPEADPITTWHLMTLDEKRQFHEQWARGYEVYLTKGVAPSVELQPLFQRFKEWMLATYKNALKAANGSIEKALNVKIDDDIRGVYDRLLASEEAIKTAEAVRNFAPIFQTPEQATEFGVDWAEYQADVGQATNTAVDELQTRSIRDMRWQANATAKKIKELQATAKAVRNDVMIDVRREVLSQPIYQAWQFLTGKNPDKIAKPEKLDPAQINPRKDTLLVAMAKMGGLDREQAIKEWGLDAKDDTKADNPGGKTLVTRKGGMTIDDMRMALEEWGYLPDSSDPATDPKVFEEMFFDALSGGEYYSQWGEAAMIAAEERKAKGNPEDGITLENTPSGKLNTETLKGMYGTEDTAPWRLLSALKMTSPDGFDPDMVANIFGFSSGDELVRRLAVAEDPKIVIEAMTDQRMLEQHGDLASEADIERAAERAIHNDVRARVLTRELNALRKATGQGPILLKAARMHAETWLARQTVKNATRHAPHAAAESRSAKATMDAMAKGDTAGAATHKRDQVLNNQLARGALRAQDEVGKAVRYLKKFDKPGTRKALDQDYLDQIDSLLERFDLRQVTQKALRKRASLAGWLAEQEALGMDPVIDARLVEDAQRQHYSTITLEEFRGLVDTVKSIEHLSRLKNRLLTAKDKRQFAAVVTELSESIVDNANRTVQDKNPITRADKVQRALIELGAHHRKFASFAREMDGGKDGGPMWEYLLRSMNAAGDQEASMRADLSNKLADLFLGIKKVKLNEKIFVPDLNISLRREEILAIALNSGNKGNVQRLMDGGINDSLRAVSAQQLMGVLNRLSNQEWDFVEGVWGLIEANRPAIAAQEKALTGVEPTWIEPDSFTLASGRVIRGGYYPAKYNGLFSTRSAELEAVTDLRQQTKGAMGNSSTRKGYTEKRAEEVSGRPLKLDLNVIAQHINEVTHRLAWQSWLIDARRLLKAPAIETAIKQHYGVAALNEMKQHLQDIADGDQAAQDAWGRIANHLRTGTTIVGMGWNIMTALAQPVGITQSIERVGAKWIGKGMKTFVANPMQATANVQQVSPFMHNRALTMNREINDVLNTVRNEKLSVIESSYFLMIQKFQQMVDVPTWLGAYEKAVAEGSNDERAIALADQAVLDSQGGGQIKDLAGMQKGNEYKKLFTNFYSFFNVLHQRMVENYRATDPRSALSVGKTAGNYLLLFVLPTVWMMALKEALRGDDEDEDELLAKYAKEQLSYIMGTTILGRELASAMSDFDYRGPTGLRFFVEFGKLYKQSMQGEVDMPWFKAFMNTAGTLLHFPAGQITRMVDGANAYIDGNAGPQAMLVGPPLRN